MQSSESSKPPDDASSPAALSIRDLSATYVERGRVLPVLDRIDLTLETGEFVAIVGPSGSGKSTLLDIVAGLTQPRMGEIAIAGQMRSTRERLGHASYMKQRDLLLPWRTVVENAAVSLEAAGVPRRIARERARARLDAFGLAGFGSSYPAQLSGGMRQRVALLRTLLAGQSLLLLDEPFGALDALTRVAMQDWLNTLLGTSRQSVLLVTHDVDEALFLADRVVVLSPRPARIAAVFPVDEPRPRRRAFIGSPDFVRAKLLIFGALGLLDDADPPR